MKKYIAPEIEKIEFSCEDVLNISDILLEENTQSGSTGKYTGPSVSLW